MAFKIKDLMVNLVSSDQALQRRNIAARCAVQSIPPTTIPTTYRLDLPGYPEPISLGLLSDLKTQLKVQLAEVEKIEAASNRSLLPKTVEEVDMLTQKLTDALEELKALRVQLSNKPEKAAAKYKTGPPVKSN